MSQRLIFQRIAAKPRLQAVVTAFGSRHGAAILESSLPGGAFSRWSVFASDPVTTVTILPSLARCPLEDLAAALAQTPHVSGAAHDVPCGCGWIGYFTYEFGLYAEGVTGPGDPDHSEPLAQFSLYDAVAVYDAVDDEWYAVAVDWPPEYAVRRPPVSERIAKITEIVRLASCQPLSGTPELPFASAATCSMSNDEYLDGVARILDYIAAGDVYQVNLTRRFQCQTDLSPLKLYQRLRAITPSSHGAFLDCGDKSLISSSPELFLRKTGRRIVTRPIKGTRPRSHDAALDRRFREELRSSGKDQAELAMIVDLARNDLGRICEYGSVSVTNPDRIERHPTVYHRVATVEGRLCRGCSLAEILRATCPGGSITGAPKIRAMEIIAELETVPRGAYCGAIGWIGLDGSVSLNLAIRTMVQRERVVDFHAGGGIVADSTPDAEYDEVMTKLSGMARAMGCSLDDLDASTKHGGHPTRLQRIPHRG